MSNLIPYIVKENLSQREINNYKIQFEDTGRRIETGLWRKKDDLYTFARFGTEKTSRRFRIINFKNYYDCVDTNLLISKININVYISCPKNEISEFFLNKFQLISENPNAKIISQDIAKLSLKCKISNLNLEISDQTENPILNKYSVFIPNDYLVLKYQIFSDNISDIEIDEENLWKVFLRPYRDENFTQLPKLLTENDNLSEFFPAQIMLGCGPSIEAGIPALNVLHKVYKVGMRNNGNGFIYTDEDTLIDDFVTNPQDSLRDISISYLKCIEAEYTNFYRQLVEAVNNGLIVGEIYNNNFDGLILREKLSEKFLRVFESTLYIPKVKFNESAKSLIVIGNHADRRQVIRAARKAGLKILYIDPEGYDSRDGFKPYPLIETLKTDYLLKISAEKFSQILNKYSFHLKKYS